MEGEIPIFNDYYKSLSVRVFEDGKRRLIISSRINGVWQERTLNDDKLKALKTVLDESLSFEEVKDKAFELIGNPNDYCTDFTKHYD